MPPMQVARKCATNGAYTCLGGVLPLYAVHTVPSRLLAAAVLASRTLTMAWNCTSNGDVEGRDKDMWSVALVALTALVALVKYTRTP